MRPGLTPSCFLLLFAGLLQSAGAFATDPAAGLQRIGKVTLGTDLLRSLYGGLIDPVAGFGYFTTAAAENPGWIAKVDLKGPVPVEVAAIPVAAGEGNLLAGAIDPLAGYAYIGSAGNPGKVIKIALGKGSAPPVYLGSTSLAPGENTVFGMLLDQSDPDPAKHYLYVSTFTSPGWIVKLAPGAGDALPSRIGAVQLASGENDPRRGGIDPAHGYAYFVTSQALVKIALGAGSALPQRVGAAQLDSTEANIGGAGFDFVHGYAYLGTYNAEVPARVVKVRLEPGASAPTRLGALTLGPGERELSTGVIDPLGGFAFFGSDHTYPAKVYKVSLGEGDTLPTEAGVLQLDAGSLGTAAYPPDGSNIAGADAGLYGEIFLQSSGIDFVNPGEGYAYFGTDTVPGQVVKVALGDPVAGAGFFTVPPCRLLDTRNAAGLLGGPALAAGGVRSFTAAGACAIPATARAIAANVTVVGPAAAGDFRLYSGSGPDPGTSTLNFGPGQVRTNNAILSLALDGSGTISVHNDSAGAAHLVVDVFGYFQ